MNSEDGILQSLLRFRFRNFRFPSSRIPGGSSSIKFPERFRFSRFTRIWILSGTDCRFRFSAERVVRFDSLTNFGRL